MQFDWVEIGIPEVGSMDEVSSSDTLGLSVEPIQMYINKLTPSDTRKTSKLVLCNCHDKHINVHYITNTKGKIKPDFRFLDTIPNHVSELLSSITSHTIHTENVESISYAALLDLHQVTKINFLKVNCDGHYGSCILRDVLTYGYEHPDAWPRSIMFSSSDITESSAINAICQDFVKFGYIILTRNAKITILERKLSCDVISSIPLILNTKPLCLHFVYGLKKQTQDLEFYKYIAILSALRCNPSLIPCFWFHYEPIGKYWDKIKSQLLLLQISTQTSVYGRSCSHYAHQADIVRLRALLEFEGVYLDIDTVTLDSFSPLLEMKKTVMGIQATTGSVYLNSPDAWGLCNATIVSSGNQNFLKKWYTQYQTFNSKIWDYHSVQLPLKLSRLYPKDIFALNQYAFFYPLWTETDSIMFSDVKIANYQRILQKSCYSIHLWESIVQRCAQITENEILCKSSIYGSIAKKFIRFDISIVMLTCNRKNVTLDCIQSYLNHIEDRIDIVEFIVLDNNSTDGLAEQLLILEKQYPKFRVIYSPSVLETCLANDILFKQVAGDIICNVSSHLKLLSPSFFDRVVVLLSRERIGMVGISGLQISNWTLDSNSSVLPHNESVNVISRYCQCFRSDVFQYGVVLDMQLSPFWCEDYSFQLLSLGYQLHVLSDVGLVQDILEEDPCNYAKYSLSEQKWEIFQKKWEMLMVKDKTKNEQVENNRKIQIRKPCLKEQKCIELSASEIFDRIYQTNLWRSGTCKSGSGATLAFNETSYIPFIMRTIALQNITSIVDIGCGDWTFSQTMYPDLCAKGNITYDGYDFSKTVIDDNNNKFATEFIRFHQIDITIPTELSLLPQADLVLIKDVLQHLPDKIVDTICVTLKNNFDLVLITNCFKEATQADIAIGAWRSLHPQYYPLSMSMAVEVLRYNGKIVAVTGKRMEEFIQ